MPASPCPRVAARNTTRSERVDDGWGQDPEEGAPPLRTSVSRDRTVKLITRNKSPDIPFEQSINPYKGCEHGCVYCFARPTHAYLDLSPGLDFETRLFYKDQAAERLREALGVAVDRLAHPVPELVRAPTAKVEVG